MNALKKQNKNKGAAIIISVLFFVITSTIVVLAVVSPITREFKGAQQLIDSKTSYYTAEAGIEDAIYRIRQAKQISATEVISLNGTNATVTIANVGSNSKELVSTSILSSLVRKVKSVLVTSIVGSSFSYGAQVGEGGLIMNPNTTVEGTGINVGNVYSNGPITGTTNANITGDALVASGLAEDTQARSTVCNADEIVGKTNPNVDYAQSFSPNDTQLLSKVSFYIKKVGVPNTATVYIVGDNSGKPDTTVLASEPLDTSFVGSSYAWIDVTFSSPATITNGTTYWIVFDSARNNSKYWIWCKDSNNGFGNGVAKYNEDWSSDPWSTAITGDLTFKIFLGSGVSSIDSVLVGGNASANAITDSTVTGDAYYDTNITGTTVTGTSYPGSADPVPLPLPFSDGNVLDWKNDGTAGGTITGDCPGTPSTAGCSTTMGPIKIDGNLTVNNTNLTVNGNIYVTGNITIKNGGTISCDVTFAEKSCVIITDGWISADNNTTFNGSGDPESYVLLLTSIEGCLGGSQTPSCAPKNSGINLSNNAVGGLFYATDSLIFMSNNVDVVSVIGYQVELDNNAKIKYETGALNTSFSAGPGGGWRISSWQETE